MLMKICSVAGNNTSDVKWVHLYCARLHEEVKKEPTQSSLIVRLILDSIDEDKILDDCMMC